MAAIFFARRWNFFSDMWSHETWHAGKGDLSAMIKQETDEEVEDYVPTSRGLSGHGSGSAPHFVQPQSEEMQPPVSIHGERAGPGPRVSLEDLAAAVKRNQQRVMAYRDYCRAQEALLNSKMQLGQGRPLCLWITPQLACSCLRCSNFA